MRLSAAEAVALVVGGDGDIALHTGAPHPHAVRVDGFDWPMPGLVGEGGDCERVEFIVMRQVLANL
jgi:hypothetical protein